MKNYFFAFVLLFSVPLFLPEQARAQAPHPIGGAIRFNVSTLHLRDPRNSSRSVERTGFAFTPGFGMATSTRLKGPFRLFVQLAYDERGAEEPYYYSTSEPPYVIHVFDRFRCVYLDALVRVQNEKGFYFAGGGSVCKPFKSYFRKNSTSSVPPPGSIIITPQRAAGFTFGVTAAIGFNVSAKTDIELNTTYDLTPALDRSDMEAYLRVFAFSVRYYFVR